MGRPKLADDLRCVSTSVRLRPDRLAKYKACGGVRWLNKILDSYAFTKELKADKIGATQ
jgi:hypothetical protein